MCLVSYVFLGKDQYVITSNRDEYPDRATSIIQEELVSGQQVFYPADTQGGSWIMASVQHRSICLLNGAFKNHERVLPYRMSRGLIMKAFFEFDDAIVFLEKINLQNIEPFTMIIRESKLLFEMRWDGNIKHIKTLDPSSNYVWSSSTLYDNKLITMRESAFFEGLAKVDHLAADQILTLHKTGGIGDSENDFKMNRKEIVKTISFSQIIFDETGYYLRHIPLEDESKSATITIQNKLETIHG